MEQLKNQLHGDDVVALNKESKQIAGEKFVLFEFDLNLVPAGPFCEKEDASFVHKEQQAPVGDQGIPSCLEKSKMIESRNASSLTLGPEAIRIGESSFEPETHALSGKFSFMLAKRQHVNLQQNAPEAYEKTALEKAAVLVEEELKCSYDVGCNATSNFNPTCGFLGIGENPQTTLEMPGGRGVPSYMEKSKMIERGDSSSFNLGPEAIRIGESSFEPETYALSGKTSVMLDKRHHVDIQQTAPEAYEKTALEKATVLVKEALKCNYDVGCNATSNFNPSSGFLGIGENPQTTLEMPGDRGVPYCLEKSKMIETEDSSSLTLGPEAIHIGESSFEPETHASSGKTSVMLAKRYHVDLQQNAPEASKKYALEKAAVLVREALKCSNEVGCNATSNFNPTGGFLGIGENPQTTLEMPNDRGVPSCLEKSKMIESGNSSSLTLGPEDTRIGESLFEPETRALSGKTSVVLAKRHHVDLQQNAPGASKKSSLEKAALLVKEALECSNEVGCNAASSFNPTCEASIKTALEKVALLVKEALECSNEVGCNAASDFNATCVFVGVGENPQTTLEMPMSLQQKICHRDDKLVVDSDTGNKRAICLELFPAGSMNDDIHTDPNAWMRRRVPLNIDHIPQPHTTMVQFHRKLEKQMFSHLDKNSIFAPKEFTRCSASQSEEVGTSTSPPPPTDEAKDHLSEESDAEESK